MAGRGCASDTDTAGVYQPIGFLISTAVSPVQRLALAPDFLAHTLDLSALELQVGKITAASKKQVSKNTANTKLGAMKFLQQ